MSTVNKIHFINNYPVVFGRSLPVKKFGLIEKIIDAFDTCAFMVSLRWLAYVLATSMHESNDTFEPVKEGYWIKPESKRVNALYNYYLKHNPGALRTIFPNGKNGTAYYGRGRVVQLTHDFNYKKASLEIYGDLRLFDNPDMIITDPECDMLVTFPGMYKGWFTGYKLSQFFPLGSNKSNPVSARKIINGLDKANLIAGYYTKFYDLLEFNDEIKPADNVAEEIPDPVKIEAEIAEAVNGQNILNGIADNDSEN